MRENNEKIFVKKVRAKAKSRYYKYKQPECYICGSPDKLELHHIRPLADIVTEYLKTIDKKEDKTDGELVLEILKNCDEIFDPKNLVTLCKLHHYYLHQLFGATYSDKVAKNVKNYVQTQRRKHYGKIH